ncbi:MAG: hypothetical protein GY716_00495 [bacterium]|nr:hypothetical protein [bacterium]
MGPFATLERVRVAWRDAPPAERAGVWRIALALYGFALAWAAVLAWMGPERRPHHYFSEGSPVDWLSAVLLTTTALLAWCTWAVDRASPRADRVIWGFSAVGFGLLAIDERFQLHERVDTELLLPWLGEPTWFRSWNDVAVVAYGVVGLVLIALVLPRIVRVRGFRELLAIGFAFYALHTAIDIVFSHSSIKTESEETVKLLAGASFVLAYLCAFVSRAAGARSAGSPPVAGRWDAVLWGIAGVFAVVVLSGGPDWQETLVRRWGDPATWLVSALLGASTILLGVVAWRSPRSSRWRWGLAAFVTGTFSVDEMLVTCWASLNHPKVRTVVPQLIHDPPAVLHHGFSWLTLALPVWIAALVLVALSAGARVRAHLLAAAVLTTLPVVLAGLESGAAGGILLHLLRIALATYIAVAGVLALAGSTSMSENG